MVQHEEEHIIAYTRSTLSLLPGPGSNNGVDRVYAMICHAHSRAGDLGTMHQHGHTPRTSSFRKSDTIGTTCACTSSVLISAYLTDSMTHRVYCDTIYLSNIINSDRHNVLLVQQDSNPSGLRLDRAALAVTGEM